MALQTDKAAELSRLHFVAFSQAERSKESPLSWLAEVYGSYQGKQLQFDYYGSATDASVCSHEDFKQVLRDEADAMPIYLIEGPSNLDEAIALTSAYPGILWVHDAVGIHEDAIIRLLSVSRAAVFSSQRMLDLWKNLHTNAALDTPLYTLPLPAIVPVEKQTASDAPGQGRLRLAFCGFPSVESRSHILLEVLEQSTEKHELHWLLDEDELLPAKALLEEYTNLQPVLSHPRNGRRWAELLQSCDGALHLSFSASRGHGIYLPISFASHCPVVVSDCSDGALLPDSSVFKIPIGSGEGEHLLRALAYLGSKDARERADNAAMLAQELYAPELIRGELMRLTAYLRLRP